MKKHFKIAAFLFHSLECFLLTFPHDTKVCLNDCGMWNTDALSSMYGITKWSLLGQALISMTTIMSICLAHGYTSTPGVRVCLRYPGATQDLKIFFHWVATI